MAAAAPPDLVLRGMLAADLPETIDMWVATWQAAYPAIDFETRRVWIVEHIANLEQQGSLAVVALTGGTIAGLLVVDPDTGYLDQIVVATPWQCKGIADRLLGEARRLSPDGLELHVNQDNARAIAFYKKHGFAVTGPAVNARSGAPVHRMAWKPG